MSKKTIRLQPWSERCLDIIDLSILNNAWVEISIQIKCGANGIVVSLLVSQ